MRAPIHQRSSPIRARRGALPGSVPARQRRRFLCQPGCRPQSRHRRPQILCAWRRRAPQARHAPHRQKSLCAGERLGDLGPRCLLQHQQRCQGSRKCRTISEMGSGQPRAARRRFRSWREGSRRSLHRRYARDGTGFPRSLCRDRQSRLADVSRQGRRFRRDVPRRGRRLLHVKEIGSQERRVRQAGQADGRPGPGRALHEPAQSLFRQ